MVISLKMYPQIVPVLGVNGTFYLFSAALLLALPLVFWILPETKDLGLEMIQLYFTPPNTIFYLETPDEEIKDETVVLNNEILKQ